MDCIMPGFPVHHQLLKLAQTHVHQVSDAIQPSHLLINYYASIFKRKALILMVMIYNSKRKIS